MISMDFSDKTLGWIETGTELGTGILAWENAATSKWAKNNPVKNYSLFSKYRFQDALCGLIGKDLTGKIFNEDMSGRGADFAPNIFGAINKTSVTGIIILIADALLKEAVPTYRKLDGVPNIVHGAGIGVTIGGVVGGIFDPNGGSSSYGSPSGFQNVPNPRGGSQQTVVALV
jgi:hypothetical protein